MILKEITLFFTGYCSDQHEVLLVDMLDCKLTRSFNNKDLDLKINVFFGSV